ncbi:MAG: pantoate--beta-alanine ligase [Solirubrobacterales bacterium]
MRELERRKADKPLSVLRTAAELRFALAQARGRGLSVGLVPTMGSFHEGHLSLMRRARAQCDVVVVSLFVNPAQFAGGEDLGSYPREEQRDTELAQAEGVDFLFVPEAQDVYPDGFSTTVEVRGLTGVLCGSPTSRGAAHFHGVTTIVAKLFNIVAPDVAYFGHKDFQQALVIKRMVRDLDMPVQIETCPTVREPDGLAMSSRNAYLSADDRARATALKDALDAAAAALREGASAENARDAAGAQLTRHAIGPEYLEILDASDLTPLEDAGNERVVVAVAATIGRARLIDNVVVDLQTQAGTDAPASAPTAMVGA